MIAAIGIAAAYVTGNPAWDAAGSIVIGCVLGGVAFYLVRENRELLLGRAVPEGVEDRFIEIVRAQPNVRSVRDVKTRQLTPEAFKLKAEITFDNELLATHLGRALPKEGDLLEEREAALQRIAAISRAVEVRSSSRSL